MDEYVEVFTASDITFAYLMKANLESAGISVQITNENLQGAFCLDGMVPGVRVPARHVEQAKQIIKEIQRSSEDGATQESTAACSDTANRKKVSTKKRIILCLVLVLVLTGLAIVVCNGGLYCYQRGGFEFSTVTDTFGDILSEDQRSMVRLGEYHVRGGGIPLLFVVNFPDYPPYELHIHIWDDTSSMKEMVIETILVDYGNGDRDVLELNREKKFGSSKRHVMLPNDTFIWAPQMTLHETIRGIVKESKTCDIKMKGYFVDSAGNKTVFDTNDHFYYEPTDWKLEWLDWDF